MSVVTMSEMLKASVHFGHQTRYWNPKMAPYIYGQYNKIHIINLEKTLPLYQEAINFVSKVAANKGTILFVGTKRAAQAIIAEEARRCGMPYVNRRWLGGLLTNFRTIRSSVNRLKEIEEMKSAGKLEGFSKKERLMYERELAKLELNLAGIKDMEKIPDALFIIDVGYESIAASEANKLSIPFVGVVDSNNSPNNIDYIIPGNDDSSRAIALYAKGVADAVLAGRQSVLDLGKDDENEIIEIDDSGNPVKAAEPKVVKKPTKRVVKVGAAQKATAKTAANKPTATKTAASAAASTKQENITQFKAKLEALTAELNEKYHTDTFHCDQQEKQKDKISVYSGRKGRSMNGRIYVVPHKDLGWCDVSLDGKIDTEVMQQALTELFGRQADKYKQKDSNPAWDTDDFAKVKQVLYRYAEIVATKSD